MDTGTIEGGVVLPLLDELTMIEEDVLGVLVKDHLEGRDAVEVGRVTDLVEDGTERLHLAEIVHEPGTE